MTTPLTPEQVGHIVDTKLLATLDGMNSTLNNTMTGLTVVIAFFALAVGANIFQHRRITEKVKSEIDSELYKLKKRLEEETHEEVTRYVREGIKLFRKEQQREEFYRNVLFKDLYEILASEIHLNGSDNLQEVFNTHAQRMMIVIQLTSGIREETLRALKKLSTGTYHTIEQQESFKAYLRLLSNSDDMEILMALENYREKRAKEREAE
jgi:GTPase SAR1 family protein